MPQSRSYDAHLQLRDIMMARALFVPILFLAAALSQAQTGPVMGAIAGAADNWSASEFGLARGSIFTIYGTNLAPSVASASRLPLPKSLNGVTVTISTNNQLVSAPLLYVSPHQINAILPSAVQEGLQIVYVDVNGVQSGPGSILVLTSRFAAFTHSQLGFGPAVLQQYNKSGVSLNGLMHPAVPGQALVLWGTGLGPLPSGSDAEAPGAVNLGNNVTVLVAGTVVKPFYAGRAPQFPGLDQINFYLPSTVPAGCYVPITVSVSGEARFEAAADLFIQGEVKFRTPPTLSVGTSNSPCASEFGLSAALVERLDQGGTVRVAALSFDSETDGQQGISNGQVGQSARAWLSDYDASNLSLLVSGWHAPHPTLSFCERQAYNGPLSPQVSATASLISQDVYGAVANDATLNFRIGGANGCFWNIPANIPRGVRGDSPGNCLASSYGLSGSAGNIALFAVSGSLPAPRQWSPGDQVLITSQGGGSIQATWNLADLKPDDQLTLDLISAKYIGGILPTGESKDSLACSVSAAGNSFLVQPDEAQWLRSLGEPGGVIRAEQVSLATFLPGSAGVTSPAPPGAPDVFLLLISNRLAAFSPPP